MTNQTNQTKTKVIHRGVTVEFTDDDIIGDIDEIELNDGYNDGYRGYVFLDNGFLLCVAFAETVEDALEVVVNNSEKLDHYKVDGDEYDSDEEYEEACESGTCLGGAGEIFDLDNVTYIELPPPKLVITKLYGEEVKEGTVLSYC